VIRNGFDDRVVVSNHDDYSDTPRYRVAIVVALTAPPRPPSTVGRWGSPCPPASPSSPAGTPRTHPEADRWSPRTWPTTPPSRRTPRSPSGSKPPAPVTPGSRSRSRSTDSPAPWPDRLAPLSPRRHGLSA